MWGIFQASTFPGRIMAWLNKSWSNWKRGFSVARCFKVRACQGVMVTLYQQCITGWWWLEHGFYFSRNIGKFIIPIDKLIFFRGVDIPPTKSALYQYPKSLTVFRASQENIELRQVIVDECGTSPEPEAKHKTGCDWHFLPMVMSIDSMYIYVNLCIRMIMYISGTSGHHGFHNVPHDLPCRLL